MLELVVRLIGSLAVVVGLMLLLAKLGARRFQSRAEAMVRVLHRQPLTRGSGISVVSVGGRVLVLGTTEANVTLLTELDPEELDLTVLETPPDAAGIPSVDTTAATAQDAPSVITALPPTTGPRTGALGGPLGGSVLSAQTWRQAFAVATRKEARNSNGTDASSDTRRREAS